MANHAIQMRISLDGIEPEIWRRFAVATSISLHRLHEIIQTVMGWENAHLYSFNIQGAEYQAPVPGEDAFDFMAVGRAPINSKTIKLYELDLKPRQKFRYTYDFGDDWTHTVLIEKIYHPQKGEAVPICLDGERSCPPEDCGSIPGYERILRVLRKAETDDDRNLLRWVGPDYDPEFFDLNGVNTALKRLKLKGRQKKRGS